MDNLIASDVSMIAAYGVGSITATVIDKIDEKIGHDVGLYNGWQRDRWHEPTLAVCDKAFYLKKIGDKALMGLTALSTFHRAYSTVTKITLGSQDLDGENYPFETPCYMIAIGLVVFGVVTGKALIMINQHIPDDWSKKSRCHIYK